MSNTRRAALIATAIVIALTAVIGVSFAVWSNMTSEKVFELKAGSLELNITSTDIADSDTPIVFGETVTMSFKIKVEGEKSTVRFSVDSFEYDGGADGAYLPVSDKLFEVELPKTVYGIAGDGENAFYTADCAVKVRLSDAFDYSSFDPLLMGRNFRFNIKAKAEPYTDPQLYDIIYHNLGNAINNNITQWSVETNYAFVDASRDGYNFEGWFTDAAYAEDSKITELFQDDPNIKNLDVYAKWSAIEYYITYVLGDGASFATEDYYKNYNADDADINLEDYIPVNNDSAMLFGGYYSDPEFTNRVTTIPSGSFGDMTLYVKWVREYNLSYVDEFNVPNDNPLKFSALDENIALNGLTYNGYTFDGWYDGEGEAANRVTVIDTSAAGDRTLYARWTINNYDIKWNLNGGTLMGQPESYTITSGDINPSEYAPTRDHYDFKGWYEDVDLTVTANTIAAGSTGDKAFYAKWEATPYSITWELNGGTLTDKPDSYNIESNEINPSDYAPTKNGYTFAGWYTDAELTNAATPIPTGSYGDKTFYAKWEAVFYDITWELNGGTIEGLPSSYTIEDEIDLATYAPTKANYDFKGWYTDASLTNAISNIALGSTGDKTIFAKWEATPYAITWNVDGGTLAGQPLTYTIEDTEINPDDFKPTKNGYKFLGWFDDAGLTVTASVIPAGSTGAREYFAKWEVVNYTITWDLDGGTLEELPGNYTIKDEIDLAPYAPTKDHYDFVGWYLNAELTNPITAIALGTTGNMTLYAKWEATKYAINWNLNGGTLTGQPNYHTVEDAEINPTSYAPTKNGYTFAGWFDDASLTVSATNIPAGSTNVKDYFAKWDLVTYSILWNLDEGTLENQPTTFTAESPDIILSNYTPTKTGYNFVGWYTDSALTYAAGNILTGSTGNRTLYAKWQIITYTITWETYGVFLNGPPKNYTVKAEIDPSKYIPSNKEGYTFDGWYTDAEFTTPAEKLPKGSTGDRTFYAKWTPVA